LSTEALARASARRPWLTIGAWFALLVVSGFLIMNLLGDALTTDADITTNPQSKQARKLIEDRLRGPQRVNEIVIVQSDSATVDDPAFRRVVEGLYQDITALGPGVVASGTNFYQSGDQ
jgi:RND superfamily putative drug exporter